METVSAAVGLLERYEDGKAEAILQNENTLDHYEDVLGTYLVQLASKRLSDEDSLKVSKMLHVIGDFERLGDHAVNLLHAAQELQNKGLRFSDAAKDELSVLTRAITEILNLSRVAYQEGDLRIAMQVEPLEQTIDRLVSERKSRHIDRLRVGECSIELGFILSDVLNDLERVSDHCSNIGVAVIELAHSSFDTHRYLSGIRSENEQYRDAFRQFALKYGVRQSS